jgi:hypothetical protein
LSDTTHRRLPCHVISSETIPCGEVALFTSFSLPLITGGFVREVAGLCKTARVQRGPSEAARCVSNGTTSLLVSPHVYSISLSFTGRATGEGGGQALSVLTALARPLLCPAAYRPASQVASAVRSCVSRVAKRSKFRRQGRRWQSTPVRWFYAHEPDHFPRPLTPATSPRSRPSPKTSTHISN